MPDPEKTFEEKLAELRVRGWRVAVHNDYQQNGQPMTFWLFTHADGYWVKGEGATDDIALEQAIRAAETGSYQKDCVDFVEWLARGDVVAASDRARFLMKNYGRDPLTQDNA